MATQGVVLAVLGFSWDSWQFWSFLALTFCVRAVALDQGFHHSLDFFLNLSESDQRLLRQGRDEND